MGTLTFQRDVDAAVEIGAFAPVFETSLSMIENVPDAEGEFVYGEEVQAQVQIEYRKFERWGSEFADFGLLRMEVKSVGQDSPLSPTDWVMMAEDPYRSRWAECARLKAADKGRTTFLPQFVSRKGMFDVVDQCDTDLWEQGKRVTASFDESQFDKDFGLKAYGAVSGRVFRLGLLKGLGKDVKALRNLEQRILKTERLVQHARDCANGTFRFTMPKYQRSMTPELSALAPSLLWFSVKQALAGPSARMGRGDLVVENVSRIFKDHLDRISKHRTDEREFTVLEEYGELDSLIDGETRAARFLRNRG